MIAALICMTVIALALVGVVIFLLIDIGVERLKINDERQAYVESLAFRAGERLVIPKGKPTLIPSPGGWFAGKTRMTNVR